MSQLSALNVNPLVTDHLHTAEYLVRSPIVENGDNEEEDGTYNNSKIKLFFYISYISIRIEIHRKKPHSSVHPPIPKHQTEKDGCTSGEENRISTIKRTS